MFEENDFDTLMERMLENVSDELDKREGSVIYDAIAPAADSAGASGSSGSGFG